MIFRTPSGSAWRTFFTYGAASILALAIDVFLYGCALQMGWHPAWAATLGFSAGLWVSYAISVRYVFQTTTRIDQRAELTLFALIGLGGLLITEILLWVFMGTFQMSPMASKLFCTPIVFLFNFFVRKAVLFPSRS